MIYREPRVHSYVPVLNRADSSEERGKLESSIDKVPSTHATLLHPSFDARMHLPESCQKVNHCWRT